MSETQRCYVCGEWSPLADERVSVNAGSRESGRVVAQCPRCFRFICTRHSENLDLTRRAALFSFGRRATGNLVACCPFDPGVPLGPEP